MSLWKKWKDKRAVENVFQKMRKVAFPWGKEQIDAEAGQLFAHLNRKVSMDEAREILIHAKARLLVHSMNPASEDKTQEEVDVALVESIRKSAQGKLDREEAEKVYTFVRMRLVDDFAAQGGIVGNSSSLPGTTQRRKPDEIVTIDAKSALQGIPMEYAWLESRYGKQDEDWKVLERVHGNSKDGKTYEIFTIDTKTQATSVIAFEISSFYGQ